MKKHLKVILSVIAVTIITGVSAVVFIPRFAAAEAGPGGGGGRDGCSSYNYSTCFGAVWRYYKTSAAYYDIPNVGGGYTRVSGCSSAGGFFAYVLVNKYQPDNETLVRSWQIGPADGDPGNRSIFFGGWTQYRVASQSSDPLPSNPGSGQYSWYSVKKAFEQTKSLGQNAGYEWNGGSTLGWFCYQGLDFELTPNITGSPSFTDGDSKGNDKATLNPTVTNAGPTTSSSATWRVVSFRVPKGGTVKGGGVSNTPPETYFGNGAVSIANGSRTFPRTTTPLAVAQQNIGDFELGTRICYALSVTPISESNTNWRHSTPFCITIAKAPKFQVHGGDIRVGSSFIGQTAPADANISTSQTTKYR